MNNTPLRSKRNWAVVRWAFLCYLAYWLLFAAGFESHVLWIFSDTMLQGSRASFAERGEFWLLSFLSILVIELMLWTKRIQEEHIKASLSGYCFACMLFAFFGMFRDFNWMLMFWTFFLYDSAVKQSN